MNSSNAGVEFPRENARGESLIQVMRRVGPIVAKNPRIMTAALRIYARSKGAKVRLNGDSLDVRRGTKVIRINATHAPYARDLIDHFDSYFDAVATHRSDGLLDLTQPRDYDLVGWDLFSVAISGLPEPMSTIQQYVDLTGMSVGQTVLDLGAYAGLSSMLFNEVVGPTGRVVAVEADPKTVLCTKVNFDRYSKVRGYAPQLIEAAVWSDDGELQFQSEASLGSAVAEVLPRSGSALVSVPCMSLSSIARHSGLRHVDILKADIEGAEYFAFLDGKFFEDQHPVLVFEPADSRVRETQLDSIGLLLRGYGYSCEVHKQLGSNLPLVVCR